jgi:hypothetical protein
MWYTLHLSASLGGLDEHRTFIDFAARVFDLLLEN